MKTLLNKIYESSSHNNLYSEVQNEIDKNGEYHTYSIENGQKKFKRGFLTFNEDGDFFTVTAFNSAKEFAEMMNVDEDAYKQYDNVKVGGCIDWGEQDGSTTQILRIW